MDFFKSVFSDDLQLTVTATSSPKSSSSSDTDADPENVVHASAWDFGGLIKTLASKSESVIENYRRDFKELGDGLKREASVISEVVDKGTSVAQESLETVGQAIDDIGASVWKSTAQIISHGRGTLLPTSDHDYNVADVNRRLSASGSGLDVNKPYSRFENQLRGLQCDEATYCTEPEDKEDYDKWRQGFSFDEKDKEIEDLISENGVVADIYRTLVPDRVADCGTFWCRYFYRVHKLKLAEDARARLVKRAMEGEEEEDLSWDYDDDEEDNNSSSNKEKMEGKEDNGSSSGKDSDISIIPSHPSNETGEDDLGWDEIEDTASNYEKVKITGSTSKSDLRNQSSAAEEEEDLSWDIKDDDDEPAK
ncbi:uncharacterized protein [Rutidosis leptorrhynchoides]|uniref:uncharacterized protein n=1 Tax=Rutidosis leptorrhynchoides TaxID=125765 RepID=UPI003A992DA8